jgi:hypothetical protein
MAKINHFSWALAAAGVLAAVGMPALITLVVSEPAGGRLSWPKRQDSFLARPRRQ